MAGIKIDGLAEYPVLLKDIEDAKEWLKKPYRDRRDWQKLYKRLVSSPAKDLIFAEGRNAEYSEVVRQFNYLSEFKINWDFNVFDRGESFLISPFMRNGKLLSIEWMKKQEEARTYTEVCESISEGWVMPSLDLYYSSILSLYFQSQRGYEGNYFSEIIDLLKSDFESLLPVMTKTIIVSNQINGLDHIIFDGLTSNIGERKTIIVDSSETISEKEKEKHICSLFDTYNSKQVEMVFEWFLGKPLKYYFASDIFEQNKDSARMSVVSLGGGVGISSVSFETILPVRLVKIKGPHPLGYRSPAIQL